MGPICGKCGDKGYEETLICCFMCHNAYEHRYCFNKASDIFKKDVKWACEDCLPVVRKKPCPKKITNLPSRKSERIRNSPAKKGSFSSKPVGEKSPAKRTMQKYENSDKEEHLELPNTDGSMICNNVAEKNLEIEVEASEVINGSLSNPEDAKSHSGDNLSSRPHQKSDFYAEPIKDPVWKGSFRISYKKLSTVWGVAAHLSTFACTKAQQEASLFPVYFHPRVLPRSTVWPKSFQKAGPKDGIIGLYFFPETDRDVEAFDSLVDEMITDDLAMICEVKNAQLLVFTSIKLPCDCWRYQGRRYLWGVFREKQLLPHLPNLNKNFK